METYPIYKDRFKGRVVVIAGAGNGIGRVCALRFAQEGAVCLNTDIDENGLKRTNELIKSVGGVCEGYVFDISKKKDVDDVVKKMLDKYQRIHVLVNSAGIAREGDFPDIPEKDLLQIIGVNLLGAFYLAQPILKHMIQYQYGKVVHISSQSGVIGRARRTHYSASKFGMNGLTQALALEVAKYGINVNAVCPSRIESEMTTGILRDRAEKQNKPFDEVKDAYIKTVPIGRLGLPEDVASLVTYLATDEASYITGQFISTSGGR